MGVSNRNPWLSGLGALLAVLAACIGQARADVTSDTPGSIVIFPKVIADGTRDTLIQLTNTSNMGTAAHCWTTNATGGPLPCQPDDFSVDFTPQQPVYWRASTGRIVNEFRCTAGDHRICTGNSDCDTPPAGGTCEATPGFFIGNPKPLVNFQGELKCVQVDASGVPMAGNSLKGEALLETLATGDVSEYNAIAVQARTNPMSVCSGGSNNGNHCAGGLDCPGGACQVQLSLDDSNYNACPQGLTFTSYSQGATDLFTNANVKGEITLVPCSEDIEHNRPTPAGSDLNPFLDPDVVIAHFDVVNEQESHGLSASVPVSCWVNLSLSDPRFGGDPVTGAGGIYDFSVVGTFVKSEITSSNVANAGLLGVFEEFHTLGSSTAAAAINLHGEGTRGISSGGKGDVIVLPENE
ncbi:MAG TPA: hypothetical protein VMW56_01650 [Candidatus Margulisiibacteriota bacterium]|nr:hypothetical protein [Candidatus Margulisiibacteriota bacterium]